MAILIHRIFATAGISLLYVTMTIQIYLIVDGFIDYRWASSIALTVSFLVPIVVVNTISAFLEFRTQSDDRYPNQRTKSVILHIAQIGLVDRCLQIYRDYDKTKVIYFNTLQLGHVMIGCVPVAIMESYLVKTNDKVDFSTILFIICSLMLIGLSLAHAEMVTMDVETPSLKFDCNTFRIITSVIGVTSLVLSRALSIVLFFEAYGYWLFLILSSNFAVVFVIMLVPALKNLDSKNIILDVFRITCVSYTNVLESFDYTTKRSKCVLFLFYAAILVENLAMSAVWMIKTDDSSGFKLGMVMTVFSSYLFGIALKYSNCCWRFEDSDELLKALEITKPYDPGESDDDTLTFKKINKTTTEFENREVIAMRDENDDALDSDRKTQVSFSNPAFDSEGEYDEIHKLKEKSVRERKKRRKPGNELPKHTTTSDGSNSRSLKLKKNKLKLFSHESASNTSRNTNTLNVSGADDPPRCRTCYKFIPGEYPVCHVTNDDNRVYSKETQKHLYHEGNIGHDPNCILRNSLVLDVSNLRLDLQNNRRNNHRFSCTDTSIESDTIDESLSEYHQNIPLQYSEVTSQDETYTEDTISNFLYANYSTSTDSELADPLPRGRKALAGHLPTEKLSPDERISAWFQHSNDYFNSHNSHDRLHADSPIENNSQFAHPCGKNGESLEDKNAQIKLKRFDDTKSRLSVAKELDRKRDLDLYSHNQVQYNYRNHEDGGRIPNVVRTLSEIDRHTGKHTNPTAQKLAHHASLYSKDGHDILRSLSVSSSNPSSNPDRRRRGHRKIPYRDALDEYYRKSTLSYHLPSNGFLRNHIAASGNTPDGATSRWSQHGGRISPSDNAVIRTRDVESVV